MSDVSVKLSLSEGMHFKGATAAGHQTAIDGEKKMAASPVEVLLEALGACTGSDIVLILGKMRTPAERLEIAIEGNRRETEPRYYTDVQLRFDVWGEGIGPDKMARAVALSFEKYCSVYYSLRPDLKTKVGFRIHAPGAEAAGEYQIVDFART